jgi:hypothetical protein
VTISRAAHGRLAPSHCRFSDGASRNRSGGRLGAHWLASETARALFLRTYRHLYEVEKRTQALRLESLVLSHLDGAWTQQPAGADIPRHDAEEKGGRTWDRTGDLPRVKRERRLRPASPGCHLCFPPFPPPACNLLGGEITLNFQGKKYGAFVAGDVLGRVESSLCQEPDNPTTYRLTVFMWSTTHVPPGEFPDIFTLGATVQQISPTLFKWTSQ